MGDARTETLRLEAGREGATWLVFKNLPDGDQIPEMTLVCEISEVATVKVDVDEAFAGRLQLRTKQVGPADAIALLTIDGTLNSVNVGALAREIDLLSAKQICRVIVQFGSSAKPPDRNVVSWLRQVALQSGRNPIVNDNFPAFPSTVVDFHFVSHQTARPAGADPDADDADPDAELYDDDSWNASTRNVHDNVTEAVDSAVLPLCELLPREELLRSIRTGDSLTKASVLRHGAERLIDGSLSYMISLTNDGDEKVSNAAVFALRQSGRPVAIETLVSIARSKHGSAKSAEPKGGRRSASDERRIMAIRSLVMSKYADAHAEVLPLLSADDSLLRIETARAIVENPRPVLSEPLADLFQSVDEQRQVELLPALAAVGHPRLLSVLEQCLASNEPRLSAAALELLVARPDPVAEELTSEWMLRHLETTEPSAQLLTFLRRTRDHRAVPLLLKHLERKSRDRDELLTTILTIGDHRVTEAVAVDFDKYDSSEKLLILRSLAEVHSELFWTLTESIIAQPVADQEPSCCCRQVAVIVPSNF